VAIGIAMTAYYYMFNLLGNVPRMLFIALAFVPYILFLFAIREARSFTAQVVTFGAILSSVCVCCWLFFPRGLIHPVMLDYIRTVLPFIHSLLAGALWLAIWRMRSKERRDAPHAPLLKIVKWIPIVVGSFTGFVLGGWLFIQQPRPPFCTSLAAPFMWFMSYVDNLRLFPRESLIGLFFVVPLWFVYWSCLGAILGCLVLVVIYIFQRLKYRAAT
jgi:hypothetical protein